MNLKKISVDWFSVCYTSSASRSLSLLCHTHLYVHIDKSGWTSNVHQVPANDKERDPSKDNINANESFPSTHSLFIHARSSNIIHNNNTRTASITYEATGERKTQQKSLLLDLYPQLDIHNAYSYSKTYRVNGSYETSDDITTVRRTILAFERTNNQNKSNENLPPPRRRHQERGLQLSELWPSVRFKFSLSDLVPQHKKTWHNYDYVGINGCVPFCCSYVSQ